MRNRLLPGCLGGLLPQGSHGSGRARLTHPARQVMDLLHTESGMKPTLHNAHPVARAWLAPVSLSAVVALRRLRGSVSSASFPSTAPSRDIPFPPQGLLGDGFPCFIGTMECSDARSLLPTRFVAFACRYHPHTDVSLPSTLRGTPRAGGLLCRFPPCGSLSNGNDRASQVPGEPLCTCPVLRPRRDLRARPLRRAGAAFRF